MKYPYFLYHLIVTIIPRALFAGSVRPPCEISGVRPYIELEIILLIRCDFDVYASR